jgi:hypothetical protein
MSRLHILGRFYKWKLSHFTDGGTGKRIQFVNFRSFYLETNPVLPFGPQVFALFLACQEGKWPRPKPWYDCELSVPFSSLSLLIMSTDKPECAKTQ